MTIENNFAFKEAKPARTYRGVALRELIVAEATDRFLERGYSAVSVEEIIQSVGGSKTNVYRHFGGKKGLFIEVIRSLASEFLEKVRSTEITGKTPSEGLRQVAHNLLAQLLDERHLAFQHLLIAEVQRFDELGKVWLESQDQQSGWVLAKFIYELQQKKQLRDVDPLLAATLFHNMLTYHPIHRAMAGLPLTAAELDTFIDEAVVVFIQGYGVSKA